MLGTSWTQLPPARGPHHLTRTFRVAEPIRFVKADERTGRGNASRTITGRLSHLLNWSHTWMGDKVH